MFKRHIFLIGSYGRGNIGDDAFLYAISKLITKHDIVINTSIDAPLPVAVREKINTVATSATKDIFKKIKYFLRSDYIIYGGGDLWVELYEDFFKRKSLWSMIFVNLLCKTFGKKIMYVGVGAGNIIGLSLKLAHFSAKLADEIIYRDETSKKAINIPGPVLPDITCTLIEDSQQAISSSKNSKVVIGLSLMYYIPNPELEFEEYLHTIVNQLQMFDKHKTEFIIFPMMISKTLDKDDLWASQQFTNLMKGYNVTISKERDIEKIMQKLSSLDLMIATRLHGSILANWMGSKSVGIAYRPKVSRYYEMMISSKLKLDLKQLNALYSLSAGVLDGKYNDEYRHTVLLGKTAKNKYEKIFKEI